MTVSSQHSFISREGWPVLLFCIAVVAALQIIFGNAVLPLWLLVAVLTWVLRDPHRVTPPMPLGVVSPVDGQILEINQAQDPYLNREALKISLRMPLSGAYTLRSVIEGKIVQHWLNGAVPEACQHSHAVWIQTDEKDDVVIALYPGRLLGRIACYLSTGERVGQGRRCGYIPLGAQMDIFLPLDTQTLVKPGARLHGGETLIAQLVHKKPLETQESE